MFPAMRRASSRVSSLAAAHLAGSSFEVDLGAQKRRGFPKTRVESSPGVDVAFGGRRAACDPSQRKCAPATVDEILTRSDPSKQKTTRDGPPASSGVVSGGGFNDDPWAGTMHRYG